MVRVGLAGYASAGRHIHAPLIREAGLELAAVATSNPERRAEVTADFPQTQVVDDLEALVALEGLDVIVLATPTGSHLAHTQRVIEAGLPCVVDKPLAVNADDALSLVDLAEHESVPLTVFQNGATTTSSRPWPRSCAKIAGEPIRCELRWERWRPMAKTAGARTPRPRAAASCSTALHLVTWPAALRSGEHVFARSRPPPRRRRTTPSSYPVTKWGDLAPGARRCGRPGTARSSARRGAAYGRPLREGLPTSSRTRRTPTAALRLAVSRTERTRCRRRPRAPPSSIAPSPRH